MARQIQPSRSRVRQLRRLWPYVLMAWERWQQLSPEEKERYKKHARDYAERGRKTIAERRKRRGR
jgi:TRAP-type C4-dicarboxylate transport system substrate-binding protein